MESLGAWHSYWGGCLDCQETEDRPFFEFELVFSPLSNEIQDTTGEPVIMPLSITQVPAARLL